MSAIAEVEEFLEHYGKKGMKWGVRNETNLAKADRQALRRSFEPLTDEQRQMFNLKSKKAKIFVPMSKDERKKNRRSTTARKARRDVGVLVGKVAASISVGIGAGYVARRIASKHMSIPAARVVGFGTSFIASDVTSHILDVSGKRKVKTLKE